MACILLWSSAVKVHDSQAYRKMDVTRERITRILELREMLLSFQTGYNLLNADIVRDILESISGLEPSSVITEPRFLKLVTVPSFCPFTLISVLLPLVFFCHQLGLLGTDLHAVGCERLCRDAHVILPVLLSLLLSHRCHQQSAVIFSASNAGNAFVIF